MLQLHQGLRDKFPTKTLPPFPRKQLFHNPRDIEYRRAAFESYLQELLKDEAIRESWEMQYFLRVKTHLGINTNLNVLMPLPDKDFDPTQVAVPWKILTSEGIKVTFATESGYKASGDAVLLAQNGIPFNLGTDFEAKQYYKEMEQDGSFCEPITWADVVPQQYDGIILAGGIAAGMKSYLESPSLQDKIIQFWELRRPVGAICHGVLLLSRCKDAKGRSLLRNRYTTTLPKYMEKAAYYLTRWKHGNLYKFELQCEEEVKQCLEDPEKQFTPGTLPRGRGHPFDDHNAFVCEDSNYLSARWPGDSYLFARRFVEKLKLYEKLRQNEGDEDFETFHEEKAEQQSPKQYTDL